MSVAPGGGLPGEVVDLLTVLARERGPTASLVIGTARGDATRALRDGGLEVEQAGRPAHLALPVMVEAGRRFGLVWLDGRHLFDHLLVDLFYADLLLEAGGVAIVNNAHWPGLRRAVAYFETNRAYRRLERGPERVAVLLKERDDDRTGNRREDAGELFRRF